MLNTKSEYVWYFGCVYKVVEKFERFTRVYATTEEQHIHKLSSVLNLRNSLLTPATEDDWKAQSLTREFERQCLR